MARVQKAILIVGGSGFVGTHLALSLRDGYRVFTTHRNHHVIIPGVTSFLAKVSDKDLLKRILYTCQPEIVIYAAGMNNNEWVTANQRVAEEVHAEGPATLINTTDLLQARFIFLSNAYPFDGNRGNFHESDIVLPETDMGKAKLAGENFIRGRSLNHVIIRSSPLLGRGNGRNFPFLDLLRIALDQGRKIEVPNYELHSFGPVWGLVDLVRKVIEAGTRNKTFHFGGLTKVTHLEMASAFAKRFGYDPTLVVPKPVPTQAGITTTLAATQKADFSLNCTAAVQAMKIQPLLLEELLEEMAARYLPKRARA